MQNKIPTFKKFNEELQKLSEEKNHIKTENKLQKIADGYHQARIKLVEMERQLIKETDLKLKEDLKKEIIEYKKVVKKNEDLFNRAIGYEDTQDLEI